ncbi:MAG: energy transducer TonB, partial [Flavisolibacter sp.]
KTRRKRVIPFYQKYRQLTAAAILVIIAGTAWLVYSVSTKQNESVAVVNKQDQKRSDSNQTVLSNPAFLNTPKQDSNLSNQKSTVTVQPPAGQIAVTHHNTAAAKKQNQAKNETAGKEVESGLATTPTSQPVAQNNVTANNAIPNNERNAFAKTAAPVEPKVNNAIEYKLNKADVNKDLATSGRQNKARPQSEIANDSTNVNIVMHPLPPDSLGLQEVVVTGYGAKKKATANVYRPHVVIDTLEPAEGYDSFDDYVADNFNLPEEYKTKTGEGEVQLSFDVDRNGQPTNITVIKSLCQKCDEEAIRLLKEGPKWKKKKDKKGKLTITF